MAVRNALLSITRVFALIAGALAIYMRDGGDGTPAVTGLACLSQVYFVAASKFPGNGTNELTFAW